MEERLCYSWQAEARRSAGTLTLKVSFHQNLGPSSGEREKDMGACAPSGSGAQLGAHLAWGTRSPSRSPLFYRNSQRMRELPQGAGTWPTWLWPLSGTQPLYWCFQRFPIVVQGCALYSLSAPSCQVRKNAQIQSGSSVVYPHPIMRISESFSPSFCTICCDNLIKYYGRIFIFFLMLVLM